MAEEVSEQVPAGCVLQVWQAQQKKTDAVQASRRNDPCETRQILPRLLSHQRTMRLPMRLAPNEHHHLICSELGGSCLRTYNKSRACPPTTCISKWARLKYPRIIMLSEQLPPRDESRPYRPRAAIVSRPALAQRTGVLPHGSRRRLRAPSAPSPGRTPALAVVAQRWRQGTAAAAGCV